MIYVKGEKDKGAVEVLGGDLDSWKLKVRLPNGQVKEWPAMAFSADEGIYEIEQAIKRANNE